MVAAVSVDRPIDVEEGLSSSSPLVYFYGHVSLDKNDVLFKRQLSVLSAQINRRFASNPDGCFSLFFIIIVIIIIIIIIIIVRIKLLFLL